MELTNSASEEMSRRIEEAKKIISVIQKSRGYKWFLFSKRLKIQFIHGNAREKKDFLLWIWSKLIRRENGSKWLREFDDLERVSSILEDLYFTGLSPAEMDAKGWKLKPTKQIFIFAGVPYYDIGGGQRCAQLAKTFNELGYRVYFFHEFKGGALSSAKSRIPTMCHKHIDQCTVDEVASLAEDGAIFVFEIPSAKFLPYFDYAEKNGFYAIYEHIDNWDTSLGRSFQYSEQVLKHYLQNATQVTVTARLLAEKLEETFHRPYVYLPNAVNSSLFEPMRAYPKPKDLVIGEKTLLYFGSLWGDWFDWEMVVYLAKNCTCEINLIGDYAALKKRIREAPRNMHFLGPKDQDELPAYLYYSDIALLPFKNDAIGKYVSPLKIFEYIAMNKPVLATPLDDIAGYPNVFCSDRKEEWASRVSENWTTTDAAVFTSQNSWYARCSALLALLPQKESAAPSVSIIILNHNNAKVIFRCINSLLAFSDKYDYEIIVVDNVSTDGSYEQLLEEYRNKIKVIRNEKNGCSSGRNLGAAEAKGDYLLFLDSDQFAVGEDYLKCPLQILQSDETIGAVGWAAGWLNPGDYRGPIAERLRDRGMFSPNVFYRTDIAYLGTGGLLMRRTLFEKIEGFDEFYDPTCFEDTDLSLKIRNAGLELAYCPYMPVIHLPHQTTHAGSKLHDQLFQKNGTYFLEKWKELNEKLLDYPLK